LRGNIALNKCQNVTTFATALGLENTVARMFINADNDAGHAVWDVGCYPEYLHSRASRITRDVQVAALDSLLQDMSVPAIKLINIDTCGAELDILQGAVRTMTSQQVPYVVCAIHRFGLQQMGTSEQALRQFMRDLGYATYYIRAEAPHLVPLPPEQAVDSDRDLHVLFARPAAVEADQVAPCA
jgi:FkbM family methyltransferase